MNKVRVFSPTEGSLKRPQSSQQKPETEERLSWKDLEEPLVLWSESPWHTQGTHMVLENLIPSETLPAWTERDRGSGERLLDSEFSGQETDWWNLSWGHLLPFLKRKDEGGAVSPQGRAFEPQRTTIPRPWWAPNGVCPAGFWNCPPPSIFSLFGWKYLYLASYACSTIVFWK